MYKNIPYLTILYDKKNCTTILCLIQLLSKNCISYYTINELKPQDYITFFKLTEVWWNRCPIVPISLYHREAFKKFKYCKHHMFNNDYQIIGGFNGVNLKYLSEKRIKRKIIHID
jgi:hypothetical protein